LSPERSPPVPEADEGLTDSSDNVATVDDRVNDDASLGDLTIGLGPLDVPDTGPEDLSDLLIRLQFAADRLGTLARKALIQLHCSEHRSTPPIGSDQEVSRR
jgi:hypothetical protein